jgi:hypothetical protein
MNELRAPQIEARRLREAFPELESLELKRLEAIVSAAYAMQTRSLPPPPDLKAVRKFAAALVRALEGCHAWLKANYDCEPHELDADIASVKRLQRVTSSQPAARRLIAQVDLLLRPQVTLSRETMIRLLFWLRGLPGCAKVRGMGRRMIEREVDRRKPLDWSALMLVGNMLPGAILPFKKRSGRGKKRSGRGASHKKIRRLAKTS